MPRPSPLPLPLPLPLPNPPGGANCAKEWDQCGGRDFRGPTCCQRGCYCSDLRKTHGDNPYYTHQCIPDHYAGCSHSENISSPIVVRNDAMAEEIGIGIGVRT